MQRIHIHIVCESLGADELIIQMIRTEAHFLNTISQLCHIRT